MTDTSQMLALFILSFGLGGVVIVALVIEQLWQRIALTLLLSYAGASLFSSGDASHVLISVPGGNLTSFAVIALSALAIARLLFFKLKDLRNFCRQYLMPQLWKPPATEPLSFDDFGKRWFVTVAAATGNVVGLLMSDPGAFHTFLDAFAPQRIFFTLLATVISIALIGPGEEFIFGAGFRSSSTYGQTHGHLEDIRKNLSWRAVGRFALVLAPWLAINVMHKCMDESINSGQIKTSLEILIASVGPGMVTFYSCAALQRGVPAVADAVFNGVVVASTFLFLPLTIFIVMHTLEQVYVVFGSRIVSDIGLVATVAIAVIAAMVLPFLVYITAIICGFVLYGLLSGFGGLVLDAERQAKRGPFQTIVRLILTAGAYQAVLFIALLALLDRFFGVSIEMSSLSNLSFLVATLGWGLGLLVSGFPTIVENARSPSP